MSIPESDPIQPKPCPTCCTTTHVTEATEDEKAWGWNWYCGNGCGTYFTGTATEYAAAQTRKIVKAAEAGELDQSSRAGRNQGVLPTNEGEHQ